MNQNTLYEWERNVMAKCRTMCYNRLNAVYSELIWHQHLRSRMVLKSWEGSLWKIQNVKSIRSETLLPMSPLPWTSSDGSDLPFYPRIPFWECFLESSYALRFSYSASDAVWCYTTRIKKTSQGQALEWRSPAPVSDYSSYRFMEWILSLSYSAGIWGSSRPQNGQKKIGLYRLPSYMFSSMMPQ